MHIGKRLKRVREVKGLTQTEMCELLGIANQATLARYEKKESLDLKMVKEFNKKLGVDLLRADFIEEENLSEVNEEIGVYTKATMQEDMMQVKAYVKTLLHHLAKLEAKITDKDVLDCLNELETDTKINLKQLIAGQ